MAAGAKACAACGKAASSDYSYDLLPDEPPKKKEEGPGFALPEGTVLPPPVTLGGGTDMGTGHEAAPKPKRSGPRPPGAGLNSGGGLTLKQIGMGALGLLVLVILMMQMCGGSSFKVTGGQPKGEGAGLLFATGPRGFPIQIMGEASYTFTVEAMDGDVSMGFVSRQPRDRITPEVIKTWTLTPVKKGEPQTLSGKMSSGSYSFVIVTESKKAVKIKYSYLVK